MYRKGLIKGSTALYVDLGEVSVPLASVGPRPGWRPRDVACPCALLRVEGGRGGHPLWERKGMVALLSSIPKRQQVMVLQMRNPKQSDA